MASSDKFVISLGGSLINPGKIDDKLISLFSLIVRKHARLGKKFIIFTGGGWLTREFQRIALTCSNLSNEILDHIGIQPTRINAALLQDTLKDLAEPEIITDPSKKLRLKKHVAVGGGWKPGASTDHCAVTFAVTHSIGLVINLSNTRYVYDSDPSVNKNAKPLKELSWEKMQELMGNNWTPGMNKPFDPIATKLAAKNKLTVVFLGPDLKNLDRYLCGKTFEGTVVR